MNQPQKTQYIRTTVLYTKGDYILFRDPELFWLGKPGHTFVGRVERSYPSADDSKILYDVMDLSVGCFRKGIDPDYMRLLPANDAMHDIDTAPLNGADAGAMSPAAVAWLRQYLQQSSAPLPRQS
ncbi:MULTISPECIES: hypothetical protein [Streptomyces]|uniref:Uncharacterized protein n=1 Tax=Streptomyces harbinensis TaxID=1176198 RepID=A0A1I6WAA4_9ACTN|nr:MULTISPECIES: hypothetical protein [Streptomyces]SFT22925.1 hypothetical protein SAMN05444716_1168 [Streptomyces harbinensis]